MSILVDFQGIVIDSHHLHSLMRVVLVLLIVFLLIQVQTIGVENLRKKKIRRRESMNEWIEETFAIAGKTLELTVCLLALTLLFPFSLPALVVVLRRRKQK